MLPAGKVAKAKLAPISVAASAVMPNERRRTRRAETLWRSRASATTSPAYIPCVRITPARKNTKSTMPNVSHQKPPSNRGKPTASATAASPSTCKPRPTDAAAYGSDGASKMPSDTLYLMAYERKQSGTPCAASKSSSRISSARAWPKASFAAARLSARSSARTPSHWNAPPAVARRSPRRSSSGGEESGSGRRMNVLCSWYCETAAWMHTAPSAMRRRKRRKPCASMPCHAGRPGRPS
mmetsp:Transcript_28597/g.71157  ORF Transcript_28597/g.71157 Transcript_28597/m.71157 type:complete len:239 (+) Transcript_28597:2248-2964(+)